MNLNKSKVESSPYVYVDPELNEVRLLTDLYCDEDENLSALTIASEGDLALLTTE